MRVTAKWARSRSHRLCPMSLRRSIAHLPQYSSEFISVGDGEPLVIVPGLAGGYELMGQLVRVLARRYRVICYQLRGERDAVPSRLAHTMADLADDLRDLLDAQLLERPTVLGLSFGAAVALEFAVRHPRRAGALVTSGIEASFRGGLGGEIARRALEHCPLPHNQPFFNQFFRVLLARRETIGSLADDVAALCWSTDQSVMAHRLRLLDQFDVRDRLDQIDIPTLVLAGSDDAVVAATRQRELAAAIAGGSFRSLAHGGHLCFLTRPSAFARRVAGFLGRAPQRVAA